MNEALYAGIFTIAGGIIVKVFDYVTSKNGKSMDDSSAIRSEQWQQITKLQDRVAQHDLDIEKWRSRYGNLYNEAQDQKDVYRSLKRDYEELKEMHNELKDMHEQLKLTHEKRERDYEELRTQHEQLLKTCDDLRLEVNRFEKQVKKDIKEEVRKEVEAITA